MKKISLFAACVAACFFCSCQKNTLAPASKNEMIPFEVTFDVEQTDPETKAWLEGSDKTIRWAVGDKVSAFDGVVSDDGGIQFEVTDATTTSATMSGSISGSASGPVYFLYPYQKYVATRGTTNYTTNCTGGNYNNGIIFPVDAPFTYSTKVMQLPAKSLMMVGKMDDPSSPGSVTMKTPMGFVKFKLEVDPSHPVTKIEITSENSDVIAGTFAIDYSGSEPVLKIQGRDEGVFAGHPSLTANKQKCAYDITITPHTDYAGEFIEGTYIIALPPQEYNWGIRMRFTDDMGMIAEKRPSSRNPLTVQRGKIKNLGTIKAADLDWHEAINLHIMNSITDCVWPFNETKVGNFATDGTLYELTYGPDNDEFKIKSGNTFAGGLYSTTGLNIKGTWTNTSSPAYIQIPGRPGKIIKEVALRVAAQSANCGNPVFADASGFDGDGKLNLLKLAEDDPLNPGEKLPGEFAWLTPVTDNALIDAWWGTKQFGWTKRWTNFNLPADTPCRIYTTATADFLKIMDLTIYYEDEP